jgi:hypothetical protein
VRPRLSGPGGEPNAELGRVPRRNPRIAVTRANVAVVQDAAVPCNCPSCGASLVIFPSSVLGQVGEKTGNVEAELDFAGALAEYRDGTERRYPVADVDGGFTCPACQTQANVGDVESMI